MSNHFELITKYKHNIYKEWKEYFNERSLTKGIWYRTLQSEPPRIPWFANTNLNRNIVVIARRLRTGHVPLNRFRHLMGKSATPNCSECGTPEDAHHLLVECVQTKSLRESLVQNFEISVKNVGVFLTILSKPLSDAAILVYKLVNRINLR